MSSIYEQLKPIATDVLKQFKQGTIEYIEIIAGLGPDDNPGPSIENIYSIDGTVRGVKFKYVQQGLAVASDLQVTFGTTGIDENGISVEVAPKQNSFITVDSIRYKIIEVLSKPAAGIAIANVLIVRK